MNWYNYEKRGWRWSIGFNPNYGGYYAKAYRDLPKQPDGKKGRVRLNGRWFYLEIVIEGGKTTAEATSKVQQRLDSINSLKEETCDTSST